MAEMEIDELKENPGLKPTQTIAIPQTRTKEKILF